MSNYIHIALNEGLEFNLKSYFDKHKINDSIYSFHDNLSIGSLYNLDENIDKRWDWLENIGDTIKSPYIFLKDKCKSMYDEYKNIYKENYSKLDFSSGCKIVIWHAKNAHEQSSLRYLVNKLKDNILYEVNVSDFIIHEYNGQKLSITHTGELEFEEVENMFNHISLIKDDRKKMLIDQWHILKNNISNLRILENEEIINVPEDYYDEELLKNISNKFTGFQHVIGTVLETSNCKSVDFLYYRLNKLIKDKNLECIGKFGKVYPGYIRVKVKANEQSDINNYIHITLNQGLEFNLKSYFNKHKINGSIYSFYDDLSIGSLDNIDENIDARYDWLENINNYSFIERDIYKEIYSKLDFLSGCKIVIWHAKSAREQSSLRYLVNKLKDNILYEVNVSDFIIHEYNGQKLPITHTGELEFEEVENVLNHISLIKDTRKKMLIDQWHILKNNTSNLRILENEEIINVPEDYYDQELLTNIGDEFITCGHVIGNMLSKPNCGNMRFLEYRLIKLIKDKKLDHVGMFGRMISSYVRLKDKKHKELSVKNKGE